MATSYRFESRWLLNAHQHTAYDVLVDLERYPSWWPQVRAVAKLGEERALVACRSLLPLTLHLDLRPVFRDRDAGRLEVAIDGDLVGWSRFTLTQHADVLQVRYEQEVVTPGRLMRVAARVGRPVLVLNHAWMMRSARRGLERRVRAADEFSALGGLPVRPD